MGKGLIWEAGEEMLWGMEEELIRGTGEELIWGTGEELIWGTREELIWGFGIGLIKEVASVANAVDCSLGSGNGTASAVPGGGDDCFCSFRCCSWSILDSMFS
jgi:hypothetical protein